MQEEMFSLVILVLQFSYIFTYCPHFVWDKQTIQKYRKCNLEESEHVSRLSTARNVKADCRSNKATGKAFYEISWEPPHVTELVTGYRVLIRYGNTRKFCFHVPANQTILEFTQSKGFYSRCKFHFAVTPVPIPAKRDKFSTHLQQPAQRVCQDEPPTQLMLANLPNKTIPMGSNFTFSCMLEPQFLTEYSIQWKFAKNHTTCTNREVLQINKHIEFSEDKCDLKIWQSTTMHTGCYVLTLTNKGGESQESIGYLDVAPGKTIDLTTKRNEIDRPWLGPLIGVVIGGIVSVSVVVMVLLYRRR